MSKKRTRKELEEIVNNLGYELLDEYTSKKQRRVVIRSPKGYKWDGQINNLIRSSKNINFFDIGNPFTLENIHLWLKLNKPEFEIYTSNIYCGSKNELMLFHNIPECQEEFRMSWNHIFQEYGCPVCSGHQVGIRTSLAYLRPDLRDEWHSCNEKTPEEVTCGCHDRVYWICSTCTYGENKEWITSVHDRVRGRGCPACAGKVVTDRNRLSTLFSKISSEWNSNRNGKLTPEDVSYGSHQKVWWTCPEGHEYPSIIKSRTIGERGCPICSGSKGEERVFSWIDRNLLKLQNIGIIACIPQKTFEDCKNKNLLLFDFGLEFKDSSWIMIEYHGPQHYEPIDFAGRGIEWAESEFSKNIKKDKIKEKYCKDNNIPLLIIPHWEFDNVEQILEQTFFI